MNRWATRFRRLRRGHTVGQSGTLLIRGMGVTQVSDAFKHSSEGEEMIRLCNLYFVQSDLSDAD